MLDDFGEPTNLSGFTDDSLSLLYKKGDKEDIKNYRPLSLLNTDYKIYTLILTTTMNDIGLEVIHSDKAGFLPKRHITDHTNLATLLFDSYNESSKTRLLVGLDNFKGYDRVEHDY